MKVEVRLERLMEWAYMAYYSTDVSGPSTMKQISELVKDIDDKELLSATKDFYQERNSTLKEKFDSSPMEQITEKALVSALRQTAEKEFVPVSQNKMSRYKDLLG